MPQIVQVVAQSVPNCQLNHDKGIMDDAEATLRHLWTVLSGQWEQSTVLIGI